MSFTGLLRNNFILRNFWTCLLVLNTLSASSQTVNFDITADNGNFCAPAQVSFKSVFSSPPLNFFWDFGVISDAYNQENPTITYLVPGTYQVMLTALIQNKVVVSTQNITIYGLPDFTITTDRDYLCQPGTMQFTAKSTEAIQTYTWNFGDGTANVSLPTETASHQYNSFGTYNVNVTATTSQGCVAQQSHSVSVQKPPATLTNDPKNGCLPANTTLEANVLVPTGSSVVSYVWNFGDGSPDVVNTSNQVNHVYTTPAGGRPKLSITTAEGCTNTYTFDTLFFGNPPKPVVLTANKPSICFSETGIFRAYAEGANEYQWDFGDNTKLITTDTLVTHKFSTVNASKVKVVAVFNGCVNEGDSLNLIINGPNVINVNFNTCAARNTFQFYNLFSGSYTSWSWDFGDGSPQSSIDGPKHTFAPDSFFTTTLIAYDAQSNCSDTSSKIIYTSIPKLVPSDSFVCKNSSVTLKVDGIPNDALQYYYFTLADGNIWKNGAQNNFMTHNATKVGLFNNEVLVYIENNCPDTLKQTFPLRVGGPETDFNYPENLCISDEMIVENTTNLLFPSDVVVAWTWNFGDGSLPVNIQSPNPVTYKNPGRYFVSLKAVDKNGCMDSVNKPVLVRSLPFIAASSSSNIECPGDTIQLTAIHQGSIRWTPASGLTCDTCSSIMTTPFVSTIYSAIASDTIGCSNTFSLNILIHVPYTFRPILRDTGFCIGGSVQLNPGIGEEGLFYSWTPAIGLSNPNILNPIASPASSTVYQLTVIDSAGCFPNTAQATITVHPLPTINAGPPVEVPFNSTFTLNPTYSPDIISYQWSPGTQLNCTTCPSPSGIALASVDYTIQASTMHGCTTKAQVSLRIECKEENLLFPTAFTPNGDNLNDHFYPLGRGIDHINKFKIYNRYGELIFERSNFKPNEKDSGWNGYFQGKPQPSGSYFYMVDAVCYLGEIIQKKGSIMLLR